MGKSAKSPASPLSSLNFLSTQIQSRHEVQEHKDQRIAKLQEFRNSNSKTSKKPISKAGRGRVSKAGSKKKPPKKTKKTAPKKITLLSAFVRDLFAAKKPIDSQSILSYFKGEKERADEFISLLETVTASPASRAGIANELSLFTGQEWQTILDTLRLKFPNLSGPKKKSLVLISKRIKAIKEAEAVEAQQISQEENSQSLWSQASNQPNSDLTTEDIKWLYDLDDEQLLSNTSVEIPEETADQPFCFTLSQVLNSTPQCSDNETTIDNSEPEIEPFSERELAILQDRVAVLPHAAKKEPTQIYSSPLKHTPLNTIQTSGVPHPQAMASNIPSRQKPIWADSIDIVTSIAFAPTEENLETIAESIESRPRSLSIIEIDSPTSRKLESSPIKPTMEDAQAHAISHGSATNWPSESEIVSSPTRAPEVLMSLENAAKITWTSEQIQFRGFLHLRQSTDPCVELRVLPQEPTQYNSISDSEDETEDKEVHTIEVSTLRKPISVLQVPSSP